MKKYILGIGIIVALLVIMVVNTYNDRQNSADIIETESGGMITSGDAAGIEPGQVAPDFTLETLDGEVVQLSDLQGQKVMLNFWASWCPPCKEEMPEMQDFYEDHGDDIVIVAVNQAETDEQVSDFIMENGYSFLSPLDRDGSVSETYKVMSLPTTYFINAAGEVQEPRKMGPMDYDYMVEMMEKLN